jgi:hypothetical protein
LENQVVQVGGGDGAQRRKLLSCLLLGKDVERPVADGPAPQVWVVESRAVEGVDDNRVDAGRALLRPRECPDGVDPATGRTSDSGGRDLAGAEEEVRIDFVQGLAGVRIDKAYGFRKELFLVAPGSGVTVGVPSRRSAKWRSNSAMCAG